MYAQQCLCVQIVIKKGMAPTIIVVHLCSLISYSNGFFFFVFACLLDCFYFIGFLRNCSRLCISWILCWQVRWDCSLCDYYFYRSLKRLCFLERFDRTRCSSQSSKQVDCDPKRGHDVKRSSLRCNAPMEQNGMLRQHGGCPARLVRSITFGKRKERQKCLWTVSM